MTGFRAIPGNRRVGHNVVVHAVAPDMWARYREVDELEEGPGYSCFGGALPSEHAQIDGYEAKYPGGLEDLDAAERLAVFREVRDRISRWIDETFDTDQPA